ncbi:MAG: hypothetical protein HY073_05860, partial [Deltaproteobacteria bacterium]|nr:hypothetical protein [Deltaproteobacteria bacterium]
PDYDFSEVRGGFFYHAPQAKISDFQAKTLDGSVSGNVEVNLQGEKPDYKFDLVMKDISIEKVPSASGLVAGKANLSVKGGGKGFAPEDLSKSLSGDGTMSMNEVQIPAVKFFEGIFSSPSWDVAGNIPGAIDKNALAGLRGVDSKASSLATSFQLVEGRVQIPKVDVQFPKAVTNLSGSIGIDKTLAFSGTMNLDRELASSFIKNPQLLDALAGGKGPLAIPLQVTGTATKPIVSPDGQFIKTGVQNFAKAEAQKKAGELMQGLLKPALPGEATAPQTPPPAKVPSKEDVGNFFKKL